MSRSTSARRLFGSLLAWPLGLNAAHSLAFLTFAVWLAAAFSAVSWGLRWTQDVVPVTPEDSPPVLAEVSSEAVARGLGAVTTPAQAPALASRVQLVGVMADANGQGIALVAVDGKTAKPYRVGKPVVEGLVLQSLQPRRALLGPAVQGPTTLTLDLPVRK